MNGSMTSPKCRQAALDAIHGDTVDEAAGG
jgi:hypothetical protein